MTTRPRQIIPIGGGGFYRDADNLELERYIIRQTGEESPRVAFVPTGLAFLPGSCCPHYDGEVQRRPSYHRLLASGEISAGVAIEDWTGVHFKDTQIYRVVTSKRGARAYSMRAVHGSVQEVPLPAEFLDAVTAQNS
jgi:peptidase E